MGFRAIIRTAWAALLVLLNLPVIGRFIEAWAEQQGVFEDPEGAVNSALRFLSDVAGYWWYQWLIVFLVGLGTGLFADWLMQRTERRASERRKAIATQLSSIARTLATMEENLQSVAFPSPATIDRFVDQIRSVELSLRKIGIPTPNIPYDVDPLGFIERMRHYASRVSALIADGHMQEARRVGRRMSQEIREETEGAKSEIPAQPRSRFADRP